MLYPPNLIGGSNYIGGSERSVQFLAETLPKYGHQAVVASLGRDRGTLTNIVNGVKVYYIGIKNLYTPFQDEGRRKVLKPLWHALDTYNPWMMREVMRVLDAERPDIVHTNVLAGFSALVWRVTKQQGVPLVHTLRDYYLLCPRSTMFRNGQNCEYQCLVCRMYASPRRLFSNQIDVVVGTSRFILERHLQFGYFTTVPRTVIFNSYYAGQSTVPLDSPSLPIRFGYLGRLSREKGVEVLLEAAKQLQTKPYWTLNLGGRGSAKYLRRLRAKYRTPATTFLGHVKPADFFSENDVLLVPSLWHEPFGRTVIEAYAHAQSVIGSNRGGIPELIEGGRTGFIFNPDSPSELAARMQLYIDQPTRISEMRTYCLEKSKSFLPENIIEQYLEVYAEISAN